MAGRRTVGGYMLQRFRLSPGMFGTNTRPKEGMVSGTFHLAYRQFREDDFCHNAIWCNGKGEQIGMGDLSMHDLHCIANLLEDDEIFIVLLEGSQRPLSDVTSPQEPDVQMVANRARIAITRMKFFTVNTQNRRSRLVLRATEFEDIPHTRLLEMMRQSQLTRA